MGFQPAHGGFYINPKLPEDWPRLTITQIKLHDFSLNIIVSKSKIKIEITDGTPDPSEFIFPPKGKWQAIYFNRKGEKVISEKVIVTEKNPGIPLCKNDSKRLILNRKF